MPEATSEQAYYQDRGKQSGWEFTIHPDSPAHDYYAMVASHITGDTSWLDLGCGSCSNLEGLIPLAQRYTGVDFADAMLCRAREKLQHSPSANFIHSDTELLPDISGSYDLITARHAPFDPLRVYELLRSGGGVFLTQQVEYLDKFRLKEAFGRGQNYGTTLSTIDPYLRKFYRFHDLHIQWQQYSCEEFYSSRGQLLELLQHTPIIPDFGQFQRDYDLLDAYIRENTTAQGIRTNSARSLIKIIRL